MPRMQSDETNTKRITIRVPKDLVEDYDAKVGNRSEAIRAHMKQTTKRTPDQDREPPRDDEKLAQAYEVLREVTGAGNSIPVREASTIVATKTNIPADSVPRRILKPLRDRGYLARIGDPINDQWLVVH